FLPIWFGWVHFQFTDHLKHLLAWVKSAHGVFDRWALLALGPLTLIGGIDYQKVFERRKLRRLEASSRAIVPNDGFMRTGQPVEKPVDALVQQTLELEKALLENDRDALKQLLIGWGAHAQAIGVDGVTNLSVEAAKRAGAESFKLWEVTPRRRFTLW